MNSEDRHPHEEEDIENNPFLVIYNYRHNLLHPSKPRLPKSNRCPLPQTRSNILTRKMAAEIEMKNHVDSKEIEINQMIPETRTEKQGSEIEKDFFTSGELEKGIPMEDKDDGDILYNLSSISMSHSHSKLEKILFGLSFNESSQEFQQQEQLIQ